MVDIQDETTLGKNEVRKKVLILRPETPTRHEVTFTITQRISDSGKIAIPTLSIKGRLDTYIESSQYAEDYGKILLIASYFMKDWTRYVK